MIILIVAGTRKATQVSADLQGEDASGTSNSDLWTSTIDN